MARVTPKSGTKALDGTAATLSASPGEVYRGITFIADPDNTEDVFLGDASAQPLQLTPGQAWTPDLQSGDEINLNDYWAKAETTAATLNWLGHQ